MQKPTINQTQREILREMRHDVDSFARQHINVVNIVFAAMVWMGLAIVGNPDVLAASLIEQMTGVRGEMYGAIFAVVSAVVLSSKKTRISLAIGIVPMIQHLLWTMLYIARDNGSVLGIPTPIYLAVVLVILSEIARHDGGA